MNIKKIVEHWLYNNFQYDITAETESTTISINHMDRVCVELFYSDDEVVVMANTLLGDPSDVRYRKVPRWIKTYKSGIGYAQPIDYTIKASDPELFDKIKDVIHSVEDDSAIFVK